MNTQSDFPKISVGGKFYQYRLLVEQSAERPHWYKVFQHKGHEEDIMLIDVETAVVVLFFPFPGYSPFVDSDLQPVAEEIAQRLKDVAESGKKSVDVQ